MNIHFDIELEKKIDIRQLSNKAEIALNEIRIFVYERIKILSEELDLYPNGFTTVYVTGHFAIKYIGYPQELVLKLQSCLTAKDVHYLEGKITAMLSDL